MPPEMGASKQPDSDPFGCFLVAPAVFNYKPARFVGRERCGVAGPAEVIVGERLSRCVLAIGPV